MLKLRIAVCGVALASTLALALLWQPMVFTFRIWGAKRAIEAREVEPAIDGLLQNLTADGKHSASHFWLARCLRHRMKFTDAQRHLFQAREYGFSPEAVDRELWLLMAHSGQIQKAELRLRQLLIDPGPDAREVCEAFVHGFSVNFRLDDANRILDVWEADFPSDPQPHVRRGYLAQSLGDHNGAVRHYKRALELAPHRQDARLKLAQAYLDLKQLPLAETEFEFLRQSRPADLNVQLGLANCRLQQGQLNEARELLLSVHQLHPESIEARRSLGNIELQELNFVEAIGWLGPLLECRPFDAGLLQTTAQAYRGAGNNKAADELFERLKQAEKLEAQQEQLLEKALREPGNPATRYDLAMLLKSMGAYEDATRWLASVLQIDPNHRAAREALSSLMSESNSSDVR